MNFWEPLYHYLLSVTPLVYLIVVILIMYIENLFPPVPGDTILAFSTYVYTVNHYPIMGLLLISLIASMAGFMTTFWIGRHWGKDFFITKNYRLMPAVFIHKVERYFSRWGNWIIMANRFMPGLRTVIAIFSGFSKLSSGRVFLYATISTILWNGLLVGIGVYLGQNWQAIEMILRQYSHLVTVFIGLALALWIYHRVRDMKKIKGVQI